MKRSIFARHIVPFCSSAVLLVYLYLDKSLPVEVSVYVGLTLVIWMLAAWCPRHRAGKQISGRSVNSSDFDRYYQVLEVETYYVRLLRATDNAAFKLDRSLQSANQTITRMHEGIRKAHELAKNTGLLAANAMMSASGCGEVGRGFVSVSNDLLNISQRVENEMTQLDQLLTLIAKTLVFPELSHRNPSQRWLQKQLAGEQTVSELANIEELLIHLHGFQKTLMSIGDNYEHTSELDVRWLQLGGAIKRVINELNDFLQMLTEVSEKLAKEMRILKISDKLSEAQLFEIKENLMKFESIDKNFEEITS